MESFEPTQVDAPPQLTRYETEKIRGKLHSRKLNWGIDRAVVAFTCHWTTSVTGDNIGKPFTMVSPAGERQVIGTILHILRERHIVAVLVDKDKEQWVMTNMNREAVRRTEKAGLAVDPIATPPPRDLVVVDCLDCLGTGAVIDHYPDCPATCQQPRHACRTCKATGEVMVRKTEEPNTLKEECVCGHKKGEVCSAELQQPVSLANRRK